MNERVLLIGDDILCMDPLSVLLSKRLGMNVLTATDGVRGYRMAAAQRPEIVIADCQCPLIGGADIMTMLTRDGALPAITILLCNDSSATKQLFSKADAYFEKPVSIFQMMPRIVSLIENRAHRQSA